MYNIKGPSKIVTKTTTRRGISQNIDNYRDYNKNKLIETEQNEVNSVPTPVFNKKSCSSSNRQQSISPQHEEIINFIHESWTSVCSELDQENIESDGSTSPQSEQSVCYYEDDPCESLQDF
ncbi:hypothetical protein NQ317_014177 [Molorchus minor]|uniref:Uncharacterized protein n=1 Tax=Molorchus minor TaxID=1323400 RepID=A0ABQ9JKB6_9CUCU|nr:hypothetical protein NQ317_014177 [Molorchus minor]